MSEQGREVPVAAARRGATKARPMGDRYFVINRWQGKNGLRAADTEYPTHEEACMAAALAFHHMRWITGEEAETFEVFVGSKAALDRRLARG